MVIIHVGMGNLEKPFCFPMTGGGEERAASRALHAPVSAPSEILACAEKCEQSNPYWHALRYKRITMQDTQINLFLCPT